MGKVNWEDLKREGVWIWRCLWGVLCWSLGKTLHRDSSISCQALQACNALGLSLPWLQNKEIKQFIWGSQSCASRGILLVMAPCSPVSGDIQQKAYRLSLSGHTRSSWRESHTLVFSNVWEGNSIRFPSGMFLLTNQKSGKTAKGSVGCIDKLLGHFPQLPHFIFILFFPHPLSLFTSLFFFPFLGLALPVSLWGSSLQPSRWRPGPTVRLRGTEGSGQASKWQAPALLEATAFLTRTSGLHFRNS